MATDTSQETLYGRLGLPEPELRQLLEEAIERAVGTERELTAHAIAHSVARVIEQDHQRIAEQLAGAGVKLE